MKDLPADSEEPDDDSIIKMALGVLERALNEGSNKYKGQHCISSEYTYVDIFILFDEAHTLTDCYDDHKESRFVVLRWALSALADEPLFSFFLSTTGKVTQFGQPRGHDASDRINDGYLASPHPYIVVGFDQLVQHRKLKRGKTTLDDVTTLDFIAHLGRPL